MRRRTRGKRGAPWGAALGVIAFVAGAAVFLWPTAQGIISQHVMDEAIDAFEASSREEADEEAYAALASYNEAVASGQAGQAADPFSDSGTEASFADAGLEDGLVGSIEIPAMQCRLPLYLGSTPEHMAKGATIVEGASAPLGGVPSNCAIAAHRGWADAAMFRDIEKLACGDQVIVTTPWDRLVYTVAATKTVGPYEREVLAIQPGRDLVTLLTCHPYGSSAYRYVVVCERSAEQEESSEVLSEEDERSQAAAARQSQGVSMLDVEGVLRLVGVGLLVGGVTLLVWAVTRRLARR